MPSGENADHFSKNHVHFYLVSFCKIAKENKVVINKYTNIKSNRLFHDESIYFEHVLANTNISLSKLSK